MGKILNKDNLCLVRSVISVSAEMNLRMGQTGIDQTKYNREEIARNLVKELMEKDYIKYETIVQPDGTINYYGSLLVYDDFA